ncbi:MAG: DNA-binding response regulator [Roseateles depolymerans]|uniref:DNA-binding response regulator n=1 Tax=Roseateles depolymerans TaxID=76731 RepID=A0A2W5DC17_9BURK|nr:MAG: DNA-binding response regulator [Roseateles depolymerans]
MPPMPPPTTPLPTDDTNGRTGILIVDDHPLLREGIAAVVAREPDLYIVGEASSGEEAVEMHRRLQPGITLMDLVLPGIDGIDAMREIQHSTPAARVLILTTYRSDQQAFRALHGGAMGFLLKSSLRSELILAVRAAVQGRRWMPPDLAADVSAISSADALSDKDLRVLELIAGGLTNREVGCALSLSEEAIRSRLKLILSKLHARDRTQAVAIAIGRGLIRPGS